MSSGYRRARIVPVVSPHPAEPAGAGRWRLGALILLVVATVSLVGVVGPTRATPRVGGPAPAFTAIDSHGNQVSLSDYAGRTVVLEWTNHDCPFVAKHYGTGNMQAIQRDAVAAGVVWLSVISSAPGTQGHLSPAEANALTMDRAAAPTKVLFDPSGTVGRAYGARVTPHMYIIDPGGTLVYMGGIDDRPTARWRDVDGATNYVRQALDELAAGVPISAPVTRAYGCTVKYAS